MSLIQEIQTAYRERLVGGWPLSLGSRVLEIGCGQGDMTSVLARVVGPEGWVTAVDLAGRDYGAPSTLGEATDLISQSEVGRWVDFRFEFDVLDPANSFEDGAFDAVVLVHSSWYFGSLEVLGQTLERVRPWARKLLFAEWDLRPYRMEQMAHLTAVLIQGQIEAFKSESVSNVRTPFSRSAFKGVLKASGWRLEAETLVETGEMQDGGWEVEQALLSYQELGSVPVPEKLRRFLASEMDVLRELAAAGATEALNAYSIVAT